MLPSFFSVNRYLCPLSRWESDLGVDAPSLRSSLQMMNRRMIDCQGTPTPIVSMNRRGCISYVSIGPARLINVLQKLKGHDSTDRFIGVVSLWAGNGGVRSRHDRRMVFRCAWNLLSTRSDGECAIRGKRFSLAALVYGGFAYDYLFLPPKFHFALNRAEYARITIYLIAAIVVRYLIQAKHKSDATREALTGRYKLLVDTSPIVIIFLDAQYKITNANPAAAETFGFGEDGLKGLSLHLLLPELQYERSTKQAISGVRRDGSRFYAEVAYGESKLDGESVSAASVRDVTEQTLAREALAASQLSLSLVLEMLPGFVWRGDPMGSFEMLSREALDYFGHVVNGPGDRTQFMHPDDLETRNRQIEKMVQTGIPQDGYYRMRDQTGKYRWFHARMNPL